MKTALLAVALLGLLGLTVGFAVRMWMMTPDTVMSAHGWTAMVLGIVVTIAVGCGLMALVFYSSRRGYDDAADGGASRHRDGEHE